MSERIKRTKKYFMKLYLNIARASLPAGKASRRRTTIRTPHFHTSTPQHFHIPYPWLRPHSLTVPPFYYRG
jgi:hypothetical protein